MSPMTQFEFDVLDVLASLDEPVEFMTIKSYLHTRFGHNDNLLLTSALVCLLEESLVRKVGGYYGEPKFLITETGKVKTCSLAPTN